MALTQATRHLNLATPLGEDELLLTAFRGQETLSRLFQFELEMISDNDAIAGADIIGKNVTFSITRGEQERRFFNGYVSQFAVGDSEDGRCNYHAVVVPWLWFLTQTSDCRIFQKMTIIDIIEQIFGDLGFSDYEISEVKGTHKQWEYCVQYRESDFNFVSRLMEQEGVFYYFRHENGKHTLVLADQAGAYKDCSENEVPYPESTGTQTQTDHITAWEHRFEFQTGKWAQTDYDFKSPSTDLMASTSSLVQVPGIDKYEVYDYPGEYVSKSDGDAEVRYRMEEVEASHDVVHGASQCKSFTPGGRFKITGPRAGGDENSSFTIRSITHEAVETLAYETGAAAEEDYHNTFTCIPDSVVFRPPRHTQKPLVSGIQTAVVTGPAGEEIYCDEFGRVKVQFHWDREGKKDENSSCWIRVSQVHAGKGWGGIDLPRIGEEVIIDFLEGDPDRPIITGRLYHAENMPPFGLPDGKSVSGLKSNSTKGGGGYNEYVMDDTKGNELIREHGQYDKDSTIEHDLREHVLNDRSRDVTNNETIQVGNDQSVSVGNNQSITVGTDQTTTVGSKQNQEVGADRSVSVGASDTLKIAADRTVDVGANLDISTGAEVLVNSGADTNITAGANISVSATGSITISAGGSSIEISAAGIKVASPAIVDLKGAVVKVNS